MRMELATEASSTCKAERVRSSTESERDGQVRFTRYKQPTHSRTSADALALLAQQPVKQFLLGTKASLATPRHNNCSTHLYTQPVLAPT
jgi:hypothetical protein